MSLLDPTSKEPLFPLIIEEIGGDSGETNDPSFYLNIDNSNASARTDNNDAATTATAHLPKFWMEAHTLSCLKRGSFQSSVELVYNDAMSTTPLNDQNSNRALHLNLVRKTIGAKDVCAYISSDGTVVNGDENETKYYGTAFCMRKSYSSKKAPSDGSLVHHVSDEQMESVADLSGLLLLRGSSKRQLGNAFEKSAIASQDATETSTEKSGGGWFQYPTYLTQKITNGVGYAMDKVLTAYDGDDDCAYAFAENNNYPTSSLTEVDDAYSSSIKSLLGKDVASTTNISLDDELDDAMVREKGGNAATAAALMVEDETLGTADEVISVTVVVTTCQHLLAYSQQLTSLVDSVRDDGENNCDFFTLGDHHHGGVKRVMLYRNGWDACSFGSFCRQAGSHYISNHPQDTTATATNANTKLIRFGKILSNVTEREVHLLASTLRHSNHALIEKDIITLFPGGIPSDFEPCQSDAALFQIHVTKMTIQNRMLRLERDANIAKGNAVKAQRKDMPKVALTHMRRRKGALEELDRCAALLTNLDASELRLERAKNDVQIVQSYTALKTALQDIHKSNDVENVEELMLDIREEMESSVGARIGDEAIYPEDAIDEDELNEEFKLLELECENEECSTKVKDEVGEKQSDDVSAKDLDVQYIAEQQHEDSNVSKAEAVAA